MRNLVSKALAPGGTLEKGTSGVSHRCIAQKKQVRNVKPLISLTKSLMTIESTPDLTSDSQDILKEQRKRLSSLLKIEAQGALVRSRFQHVTEIDTCWTYFFNLEKSHSNSKTITHVRLSLGMISDKPDEIRSHVHNFYQSLYSRVQTDENAREQLLQNLSQLNSADSDDLDSQISIEELDNAIKQLGNNKSPGLDGLSSEFF